MPWRRARFRDKEIWAEVDAAGEPVVEAGRVAIRYSPRAGAKLYRAGSARVDPVPGASPEALPPGVSADAAPAKPKGRRGASSGFGSAGTRTAGQAAAARASARGAIDALSPETHRAFTDGACKGNPGPCGAGAVVVTAAGERLEASRSLGIATNNVGELTAVGMALDLLEEAGVDPGSPVALFTDSKYSLGVLTKGWKAKANRALILGLRDRLKGWPRLEIRWIAGHVGVAENERADELANRGVGMSRL